MTIAELITILETFPQERMILQTSEENTLCHVRGAFMTFVKDSCIPGNFFMIDARSPGAVPAVVLRD